MTRGDANDFDITDTIAEDEKAYLDKDGRCPDCFHRFAFHVSCDRGDYCLIRPCDCSTEAPRYGLV